MSRFADEEAKDVFRPAVVLTTIVFGMMVLLKIENVLSGEPVEMTLLVATAGGFVSVLAASYADDA